jgi:hypothetical protein
MFWPVSDEKGHVKGASVRLPFSNFQMALVHVRPTAETLLVRTGAGGDSSTMMTMMMHRCSAADTAASGYSHRPTGTGSGSNKDRRWLLRVSLLLSLGLCFCMAMASSSLAAGYSAIARRRQNQPRDGANNNSMNKASAAPSLGLRLTLDDTAQDRHTFCQRHERNKMRHTIWNAIGHSVGNNKMRSRITSAVDPVECAEFCHGKAPGQCFLAHPLCSGWSREEQTSGIDESLLASASSSHDRVHPDKVLASVSKGRFLATKKVISGDMKLKCKKAVDTLLAELKEHAKKDFDVPCQRLLQKLVSVACFVL